MYYTVLLNFRSGVPHAQDHLGLLLPQDHPQPLPELPLWVGYPLIITLGSAFELSLVRASKLLHGASVTDFNWLRYCYEMRDGGLKRLNH